MQVFVFILLGIFVASAHAQFGIGLAPGSTCSSPFGPARGAQNGQDELMNLSGQLAARNTRIDQLRAKEERLDHYIAKAKRNIGEVLTSRGFAALREHRERNNSYGSYRQACGGGGGGNTAIADNRYTDPELFSTGAPRANVDPDVTLVPPPDAFCVANPSTHARENIWEKFVEDDGTVSDRICDFRIAGVTHRASAQGRELCHEGMHEYYERMAERERIHAEIARLDREARNYERRLNRIRDEITDGTYCWQCAAQRRGYSTMGTGNSMMQGVGLLAMLSISLNRQPMYGGQMMPPPYYRPPFGAPVMPYGGPGFPIRPYPAQIPGYAGMMPGPRPGMGTYGGVPGGIGPGAFGCQGANPMGFGNQFGSPMVNSIFGGQSPFNNPYANPAMMPMFMQGAGPGWGFPMYANGMPGFQDPFGLGPHPFGQNPFGNPLFANQNPFGMNSPFGMNPYGMNPYLMNPYGMNNPYAMNPYAMGNPFGFNPYGSSPFGMNPYGMNPYGMGPYGMGPYGPGNPYQGPFNPYGPPGMMPYMGMNPYGGMNPFGTPYGPGYGSPYGLMPPGGIPNYGYQSPWGMPLGSPTGNFLNQISMLTNRIQYIQNGGYYGGVGTAPPVAPYMGTPVYNTPGTMMNPLPPRANPPAVLPYTH